MQTSDDHAPRERETISTVIASEAEAIHVPA